MQTLRKNKAPFGELAKENPSEILICFWTLSYLRLQASGAVTCRRINVIFDCRIGSFISLPYNYQLFLSSPFYLKKHSKLFEEIPPFVQWIHHWKLTQFYYQFFDGSYNVGCRTDKKQSFSNIDVLGRNLYQYHIGKRCISY